MFVGSFVGAAGLPVNRQKKGVHVAGWHFYNNLALYLLQPCGVHETTTAGFHLDGKTAQVPEKIEENEGEDTEGEGDEAASEEFQSPSVLLGSSEGQRPAFLSPPQPSSGFSSSSSPAPDFLRAKQRQGGKRAKRSGRLLDTISSPMLCCEIAAALARVGVPQPALLHAMVERAESEGSQWMHLQHLISLMR